MKKKFLILVSLLLGVFAFSGCSTTREAIIFPDYVQATDEYGQAQLIAANAVESVVTVFIANTSDSIVSFGSGVAIASGGYIATNYHVVANVVETPGHYHVVVSHNNSEEKHDAEILWSSYILDLAIIKCQHGLLECDLQPVLTEDRFVFPEDSDIDPLRSLEMVIAIGTPIDPSLQNSVTLGYISSSEGRFSTSGGLVYENLIQHISPINHGNSGGPLFDLQGNVIGLNTLGNDDANSLFFAVPIYPIKEIISRVVADNNWRDGKLGISGVDKYQAYEYNHDTNLSNDVPDFTEDGVLIIEDPDVTSPSFGKLDENDVIKGITVNEKYYEVSIRNNLLYPLLKANIGETVTIHFGDEGSSSISTVDITLYYPL